MKDMLIWRLTPVATDDPMWQASAHRDPLIVRAPDEKSARAAAQKQFGVSMRFPPGTGVVAAPWKRPNLAVAEIVEHSRHDTNGPLEVLEPSFETDLQPQPSPWPRKKETGR
jgi:hypothetical protein